MSATFVERFRAVVVRERERLAIDGRERLTYGELETLARVHAAALVRRGVGRGDVVLQAFPRCSDAVIGVLGAWLIGAAVLPVDPTWPADRIASMAHEVGVSVELRSLDRSGAALDEPKIVHAGAGDVAYVIASSGSTGKPKAIRVSHRGLVPVLDEQIAAIGLVSGSRSLWMLSPAFDASFSDIGTALLAGATLVIADDHALRSAEGLVDLIREHRVTYVDLPIALLRLIDPTSLPTTLRTVLVGGEAAPIETMRRWAARVRLLSVYGPTEATICTSLGLCDPEKWLYPSIGQPLSSVTYRVVDDELWIGGPCLALGYVARPELDAARFVERDGERWYRTGDRVRARDHDLEFLGRIDRQAKIQGRLFAPEEVERALADHPDVREAAVVVRDQNVVAFVAGNAPVIDLRAHLRRSLPPWMIPRRFAAMAALPRGTAGKVDILALDRIVLAEPRAAFEGPGAALAALVARVLGVDAVGLDDDFFALGGDSYAALAFVVAADAAGLRLPSGAPYAAPTVRAMLAHGEARAWSASELAAVAARYPGAPRVGHSKGDAIVITGALGFLGRHLVGALRARTDRPLVLVMRPGSEARGERLFARYSRASIVGGDVAQGIDDGLAGDVGDVVHLAAKVSLVEPFAAHVRANVEATLHAQRFANARGATLHHASTLSVVANVDDAGLLHGGYAQSKHVAEAIARRDPSARVLRLGLLTGRSDTGAHAIGCQLAAFVRGLMTLGVVPGGDHETLRFDATPIDHAAERVAEVVLAGGPGVVTIASAAPPSLADLLTAIARSGTSIERVSAAKFRAIVASRANDADVAITSLAVAPRLLGGGPRAADLFLGGPARGVVDHAYLDRVVRAARLGVTA